MAGKKSEENPAQGGITSKWLGRWRCGAALAEGTSPWGALSLSSGMMFYDRQNMYRSYTPQNLWSGGIFDSKTQGASSPGGWIGCSGERADIEQRSHICVSQRLLPELSGWEISILVCVPRGLQSPSVYITLLISETSPTKLILTSIWIYSSQKDLSLDFPGDPVVANPLPMQATQVQSLVWEDPHAARNN